LTVTFDYITNAKKHLIQTQIYFVIVNCRIENEMKVYLNSDHWKRTEDPAWNTNPYFVKSTARAVPSTQEIYNAKAPRKQRDNYLK
jgi:hypothetical protein